MIVPRHAHDARSPLHDWRVAAESSRAAVGSVRRYETPFVGREDLLHQFHQIVAQARASDGLVITLTGEAGIGKSRLLRELARRGTLLGLDVLWLDDPAPPPHPGRGGGRRTAAPGHGGRPVARPTPRSRGARRPGAARRAGRHVPGARADGRCRGAARPGSCSPRSPGGTCSRDAGAAARRGRAVRADEPPPRRSAERPPARDDQLAERGNPFLAEELILDLVRLGLVAGERGTWYLLSDVPPSYVPERVAATLGFELDAIEPGRPPDPLQRRRPRGRIPLRRAGRGRHRAPATSCCSTSKPGSPHGIVREAAEPPDDFQFTHELVRRVLYRRLSGIRRRRLHQAVAEALERQTVSTRATPTRAPPWPTTSPGASIGSARSAHILRAQERAEHLRAWDDAIRYCREGLDLARQAEAADVGPPARPAGAARGALLRAGADVRDRRLLARSAPRLRAGRRRPCSALRRAALAARLAALGPSWYSIEAAEAMLDQALDASAPLAPGRGRLALRRLPRAWARPPAGRPAWRGDPLPQPRRRRRRSGRLAAPGARAGHARRRADHCWPPGRGCQPAPRGARPPGVRLARAARAASPDQLPARSASDPLPGARRAGPGADRASGELDEAARLVELVHEEEAQFGMLGEPGAAGDGPDRAGPASGRATRSRSWRPGCTSLPPARSAPSASPTCCCWPRPS